MKLQWRQDGNGVYILQSYVGVTSDGKEIWSDVPTVKAEPTKTKREEIVEWLAKAMWDKDWSVTDRSSKYAAEAVLDYLRAKMPIIHPCGAETPSYYRALSDVRLALFGEA